MVQAAVAGRASRLEVFTAHDGVTFQLKPTLYQERIQFGDLVTTESSPDRRDWLYLKPALWDLVGLGLAFQCQSPDGVTWDFQNRTLEPGDHEPHFHFRLSVNCRTDLWRSRLSEKRGSPLSLCATDFDSGTATLPLIEQLPSAEEAESAQVLSMVLVNWTPRKSSFRLSTDLIHAETETCPENPEVKV